MTIKGYIKTKTREKDFLWKGIFVYIKDKITNDISLKSALSKLESKIPDHLLRNVDSIYVGQFPELLERDLNAIYKEGAIYVLNTQDNEEDLCDDIVHEIAHSVEEENKISIYGDGKIEKEFLEKREKLYHALIDEGYKLNYSYFINPEYDHDFDMFLYQEVGYPLLTMLTINDFYSPYGATSLSEYFANAFEGLFYYGETERIKKISPFLFDKLVNLLYNKEYDNQ